MIEAIRHKFSCQKYLVRTILNVGFKNFVSESNDEINSNTKREHECNREECRASE